MFELLQLCKLVRVPSSGAKTVNRLKSQYEYEYMHVNTLGV